MARWESFSCASEVANPTLDTSSPEMLNPLGGNVWAFTLFVTRADGKGTAIDDFAAPYSVFPSPLTKDPEYTYDQQYDPSAWPSTAVADGPDARVGIVCGPSDAADAVNCTAGTASSKLLGYIPESEIVEGGSIDLGQAYCKHLPKGAKAGTPAIPTARVWLVVSDNSGAMDGPFALPLNKACPKVANVVPAKHKKHKQHKKSKKQAAHKRSAEKDRAAIRRV